MSDASRPVVSIVTPCLNRRTQLEGVLDSVAAQTYPRIEHIVVDGGSTDGTQDLLRRREGSGIRWISEPDNGVYAAVNKGFALATGEVLAYLNSDDRYFEYSVEVAVKALTQDPRLGFVYGDLLRYHASRRQGELLFYPPHDSGFIARGHLISQPTVFLTRAAVEVVGEFDETFRLAADMDYWVRVGKTFAARKLDEVIAFETFHGGQLTAGAEAAAIAHEELGRVAGRVLDANVSRAKAVTDRIRATWWDRVDRVRFALGRPSRGRWTRFRETTFRVHRGKLLLSLVPVFGRPFRICVSVPTLPWAELEKLETDRDGDGS